MENIATILPVRKQSELIYKILEQRFETILPVAMKEANIDMWIILCQEDNHDPVFTSMIPFNCWTPILQILVFRKKSNEEVERVNLSMTNMHDLFKSPWQGRNQLEQWQLLSDIIRQHDPQTIGLNIGKVQWAAGGLTYNLYHQFMDAIDDEYRSRIVDAEKACTHWLMSYSDLELEIYPYIVGIAHDFIATCFSTNTIIPGFTQIKELEWAYWQMVIDHGLDISFTPFFRIIRSDRDKEAYGESDQIIRRGDILHCDVGIRYLRLCTDHQEVAYVLRTDETDLPVGIKNLLSENNRLQKVFMSNFQEGLTGDQMLKNILTEAHEHGIPNPKVYSHSLGLYLHEPGPLIGLPWEQESNPGRGDVKLVKNSGFTMELSIEGFVPEWDQMIRLGTEQDVLFTQDGCWPVDGVQTKFHII